MRRAANNLRCSKSYAAIEGSPIVGLRFAASNHEMTRTSKCRTLVSIGLALVFSFHLAVTGFEAVDSDLALGSTPAIRPNRPSTQAKRIEDAAASISMAEQPAVVLSIYTRLLPGAAIPEPKTSFEDGVLLRAPPVLLASEFNKHIRSTLWTQQRSSFFF
jgi:hypothetical protein